MEDGITLEETALEAEGELRKLMFIVNNFDEFWEMNQNDVVFHCFLSLGRKFVISVSKLLAFIKNEYKT